MTLQQPAQPHRRPVEVAVLSDLHLGMRGCRATEVLAYLRSIDPEVLVLNGDIIDIWQFKKKYFPPAHSQVIEVAYSDESTEVLEHALVLLAQGT